MKSNNKFLKQLYPIVLEKYEKELSETIITNANKRLIGLYSENNDDNKYMKPHTFKKIYPVISLFYSMLNEGIKKDEASNFIDYALCKNAEKKAKAMRSMLKIPGLYKLMPKIFKKVTIKSFGKKAGFDYVFYNTPKTKCKFDMIKCLYYDTLKVYGCECLCKGFCHTDDVCDSAMHKNIVWDRTMTIGEGYELCDFNLYIDQENKKAMK